MTIVLATTNRWKVPEYRRFFARHAQALVVETRTEDPKTLDAWLTNARAVLADESNIFDEAGDQVSADYVGPARNICWLHAWMRAPGDSHTVVKKTYVREVRGHFDGTALRPDDPTVFDWDSAFRATTGPTLEAMERAGLKNSAREQCLSAFAKNHLHRAAPLKLRWSEVAEPPFSLDVAPLKEHPLYQHLRAPIGNALAYVLDRGVFFRAKKSRRDGNYWFPGLNGGLPYVPKGDPIHEATYLFHDVMHHLMPDLVFDGADSIDHKRAYIAYRMMSEGVSLVLADMVFASTLADDPANANYDFTARRILPLYRAIPWRDDLRRLLRAVTGFVLRGVVGDLPIDTDAWRAFDAKYTRFFVADFQWTRMNWQNLVGRSAMVREWIDLVGPEAFAAQEVWFLGRVVEEVGRGLSVEEMCDRLFDIVWTRRIEPALAFDELFDAAAARSAGFRRWLTGQVAFFARYAPIATMPPLAHELAARIRDPRDFDDAEIADIRRRFGDHVRTLAKEGILSNDDAEIFPDLFPLFDPFFLRDYDIAQQEFKTVAEASARAFAEP
jgi:hypothetical protein